MTGAESALGSTKRFQKQSFGICAVAGAFRRQSRRMIVNRVIGI
jgi:hypothetical protein